MDAVVLENTHLADSHVPRVDEYLLMRRKTGGIEPCFALLELGMDIPDSAINDPVVKELFTLASDMVMLSNVSIDVNIVSGQVKTKAQTRICYLSTRNSVLVKHITWSLSL